MKHPKDALIEAKLALAVAEAATELSGRTGWQNLRKTITGLRSEAITEMTYGEVSEIRVARLQGTLRLANLFLQGVEGSADQVTFLRQRVEGLMKQADELHNLELDEPMDKLDRELAEVLRQGDPNSEDFR